jgi:hypothetical protein
MKPLLKPEQAARMLAVSVRRVHALCREGKLEYVSVNRRGDRRFTEKQIQDFIASETVKVPKSVDKERPVSLPYPRKGGDRSKSVGDSGQSPSLREEVRALCQ